MKAAVYKRYGPPEVVQIREVKKPVPGDNEILIRVHATTVARGDVRMRGFQVPLSEWLLSRLVLGIFGPRRKILGMELAGEIESAGRNVTRFKAGDRVFASTFQGLRFGAHAEYVCLSADAMVELIPDNLSDEEAATFPSGGVAALLFIRDLGIQPGQEILINGASGTLGTFGIQLALHYGAEVTGVCSSANTGLVKSLGAARAIDYTREDFTQAGERYDIIFDTVGKIPKSAYGRALKPAGKYVSVLTHHVPRPDRWDLVFLRELIEQGKIKPVIDRTYPLEQIAEAHRYVEKGHKKGNVVISMTPTRVRPADSR